MTPIQSALKTRIAFVANVGYSLFRDHVQETYGGGQIEMYLLAEELRKKQNYDIAMIFLDYGQPHEEHIDGIHLIKSYRPRRKDGFLWWQFMVACYRLWGALRRANADMYFHEGAEFEIAVTRVFCFVKKRKYVFRCANIIDVDGRYHQTNPLHGRLFSFGLSGASAIIAQTKDQERLLNGNGKPISIIENMYPYSSRPTLEKNREIVWMGRLTKIKRPEIFLLLVEKFPNDHFLMIGSVDTIDRDFAFAIQSRTKNIRNLRYVEKIPFQKTPEIFNQTRLLVNTSEYEGFPMTFVQAMCFGVPILTLGIDPDTTVSSVAGLVARDGQDLVAKYSLLQQKTVWERYSRTAFEFAKNHYSPQIIVPKYEAVFQRALGQ